MTLELDTFLVSIYYYVDLLFQRFFAAHRPPPHPRERMSDSYVITLFVISQWSAHRAEARSLRYARKHWLPYFKYILSQSAFNKRVRALAGVICYMVPLVEKELRAYFGINSNYQILDCVAVPVMERCRGDQSHLFVESAAIGKGGSGRKFYYGFKLLEAINDAGFVTGFVAGPANTEERFLAEAMLSWRVDPDLEAPSGASINNLMGKRHGVGKKEYRSGPTGPLSSCGVGYFSQVPYITDLGFKGKQWEKHWKEEFGATLLNKSHMNELPSKVKENRKKWLSRLRQDVETSFYWQLSELHLRNNKARSYGGWLARTGAKLFGYNIMVGLNIERGKGKFEMSGYNALEM
jgi:hypothetical protein